MVATLTWAFNDWLQRSFRGTRVSAVSLVFQWPLVLNLPLLVWIITRDTALLKRSWQICQVLKHNIDDQRVTWQSCQRSWILTMQLRVDESCLYSTLSISETNSTWETHYPQIRTSKPIMVINRKQNLDSDERFHLSGSFFSIEGHF